MWLEVPTKSNMKVDRPQITRTTYNKWMHSSSMPEAKAIAPLLVIFYEVLNLPSSDTYSYTHKKHGGTKKRARRLTAVAREEGRGARWPGD